MNLLIFLYTAILLVACGAFSSPITSYPPKIECRSSLFLERRPGSSSPSPGGGIEGLIDPKNWNAEAAPPVRIEGNSLRTWSFPSSVSSGGAATERVLVTLKSAGRPIEARVELWQNPSYTPTKFEVECEDGSDGVVHSVIELPRVHPATVAVYNTEGPDFPMEASVAEEVVGENLGGSAMAAFRDETPQYIEGGKAVKSYGFGPGVESVEILLRTKARNMKAYIEILQGPNDDDELIRVETDDAQAHPFFTVVQTPGGANTLRIVNENTVEFPLEAFVRPFETVSDDDEKASEFDYGGPYF